jgi:hypothetical protein
MSFDHMSWDDIQHRADEILAEGIFALRSAPAGAAPGKASNKAGNYLISLGGVPYYVGEGIDLAARLKQQFTARTSTFYKNYLKDAPEHVAEIGDFSVQHMETALGRKEIEDFGIVNIPTRLNRFQLDKRARRTPATTADMWAEVQARRAELLEQGDSSFCSRPQHPMLQANPPDHPGLYAVREGGTDRLIYIGESSGLASRHKTHCGQTYFSALRRHVGTELHGYQLQVIKGKKRYFAEHEDREVTGYLGQCTYQFMPTHLGRIEIEEYMIKKHRPYLNRKSAER